MAMEKKPTYSTSVTRHNVTVEELMSFINDNIVKIIFLDEQYADISSDKTVTEIHKFKSKYRGNTYIRVPVKIVKGEDDKYVKGIEIIDSEENAQGFLVVSKRDIRDLSKELKKANAEQRVEYGTKLCLAYLKKLNKMFVNNILEVVVKDESNNTIKKILIPGDNDFSGIYKNVSKIVEGISSGSDNIEII